MSDTTIELPPDTTLPQGTPQEDAPQERPLSAREQTMLDIVAGRERARALELAYGRDAQVDPPPEDPEAAQAREDAETEAARKALETAQSSEPATPAPRPGAALQAPPTAPQTVIIGGIHFTPEQAAQLAQDGLVARRAVQEFQRQQQARPAVQPVPEPVHRGPIITDAEAESFAQKLVYGDKAENTNAIKSLADIIASRVPAPMLPDPRAIIEQAKRETRAEQDLRDNLRTVGEEFPEIFGTPSEFTPAHNRRSQLAALTLGDLRQRYNALGIQKPDLELYREAAKTVRDELGLATPQPQPAPGGSTASQAAPMASRLERKRAAPSLPQSADRRAVASPSRAYPSNSEYIEQMRKQRGLPPMR